MIMKRNSLTIFAIALATSLAGWGTVPSRADTLEGEAPLLIAQNDCYAIGQRIAGENGRARWPRPPRKRRAAGPCAES